MVLDVCPVQIVDTRGVRMNIWRNRKIHHPNPSIPGFRRETVMDRLIKLTRKQIRKRGGINELD